MSVEQIVREEKIVPVGLGEAVVIMSEDKFIGPTHELWNEILDDYDPIDVPDIPWDRAKLLSKCKFDPNKSVAQSHGLVYVPAGISLADIKEYCDEQTDLPLKLYFANGEEWCKTQDFFHAKTEKGRWWLMYLGVLPGSQSLSFDKQIDLLKKTAPECDLISALPYTILEIFGCREHNSYKTVDLYARCIETANSLPFDKMNDRIGLKTVYVGYFADTREESLPEGLLINANRELDAWEWVGLAVSMRNQKI